MIGRKHIPLTVSALLLSAALLYVFLSARGSEKRTFCAEFPAMGTIAKVSVYRAEDLNRAWDLCKTEFDAVEKICSLHDPDSELSRLNSSAAERPFVCSDELWRLIKRSEQAYIDSSGSFDITVKPLMDLWGFYRKQEKAPSAQEIADVMKFVGFDKLRLDEKTQSVFFTLRGMALDLGGIAKGFAADRAAEKIADVGILCGVIDIGGNLRMLPKPPPGKNSYHVAVRDPYDTDRCLPELLTAAPGMAVSTSGNYERFVIFNGKRYSHIISALTGRPSEITAVSVIAGSAMDADIFSTACCVGGDVCAEKIKKTYPETEIYFTR